jgi:hypothetical protein
MPRRKKSAIPDIFSLRDRDFTDTSRTKRDFNGKNQNFLQYKELPPL